LAIDGGGAPRGGDEGALGTAKSNALTGNTASKEAENEKTNVAAHRESPSTF
jgi:hypothetical protein